MAIAQTVSLALKCCILVLEAISKRKILLAPYQDLPPEATSGIYNRSVFWWLTPLFRLGFKKNLDLKDLDDLDESLRSARLYRIFKDHWAKGKFLESHLTHLSRVSVADLVGVQQTRVESMHFSLQRSALSNGQFFMEPVLVFCSLVSNMPNPSF